MSSARILVLSFALALLAACSSGGGGDEDTTVFHLRGVHVIEDAPQLQFYVDNTAIATADYGGITDFKPAHPGTRPLKVGARAPADLSGTDPGFTDLAGGLDHTFQATTEYTLVAAGTVAAPEIIVMEGTERDAPADNIVAWRIVNAASNAGSLDVYITAPEAGITTPQLADTLTAGDYSASSDLTLAAASGADEAATRSVNITIELRAAGGATLYQSAAINVTEQNRLLLVIDDHEGPAGASSVKVISFPGAAAGNGGVAFDPDDGAEMSFANLSGDAGAMDLIVGSSAADIFAANVAYGAKASYDVLPGASVNAIATPAGNPGAFLFVNEFTATTDRSYTLYAQGASGSLRGVLLVDDRRSIPTEARFRFLHGAPSESGNSIDVYLKRSGETLDLSGTSPPAPNISALGYRSVSPYFSLKEGSYDAYFTKAGVKTVIAGPITLALVNGSVQTLAFANSPASTLELVALDDARP